MKTIKYLAAYIGTFWHGYIMLRDLKKTKLGIIEYLDFYCRKISRKSGLDCELIYTATSKASKHFWFYRQQVCLARSLAAYYYLVAYGYDPYLFIEFDFQSKVYHNCHAWVCTNKELQDNYLNKLNVLKIKKRFIILQKDNGKGKKLNGQYSTDRLLQSEVSLLFCSDCNGRQKKTYEHEKFQKNNKLS